MWFIFPKLRGWGSSEMSNFYGISGRTEARQYLAEPNLGSRLIECTSLVLRHSQSIETFFRSTGDSKTTAFLDDRN